MIQYGSGLKLKSFSSAIATATTTLIDTFACAPNAGLSFLCKGDGAYTLRLTHGDVEDGALFQVEDFSILAAGSTVHFIPGGTLCKAEIVSAGALNPVVRVFGRGQ